MIILQSQDKKLWDGLHIGYGDTEPVIYSQGYVVGKYLSAGQCIYVMEQIALAIERGDRLYRMPSIWDVERALMPEEDSESEAKCLRCRYAVMSNEEIQDAGGDPCETCQGLSNWKAKEAQP